MHKSLWWSCFTITLDRLAESSGKIKGDIWSILSIFMDAYNELSAIIMNTLLCDQ